MDGSLLASIMGEIPLLPVEAGLMWTDQQERITETTRGRESILGVDGRAHLPFETSDEVGLSEACPSCPRWGKESQLINSRPSSGLESCFCKVLSPLSRQDETPSTSRPPWSAGSKPSAKDHIIDGAHPRHRPHRRIRASVRTEGYHGPDSLVGFAGWVGPNDPSPSLAFQSPG